MTFTEFGKSIMEWRQHHGFCTPTSLDVPIGAWTFTKGNAVVIHGRDLMLGKLMLCVTEVTEMDEAGDLANYREEMADIAIRILDITSALDIDIDKQLEKHPKVGWVRNHMTLVNEISKAAEGVRKDKLTAIAQHLACAFHIIIFLSGKFDLMAEMEKKMAVNWKRPIKHGKLCSL